MIFLPGCRCCQTPGGIYINRCGYGCNYTWEIDGLSQSMGRCSNEVPEAYQGEGFQRNGCDDTFFQRENPYWTSGTVLQSAVGYQGITSTTNYPAYGAVNYTFGFDDGQTLGRYQNSVSKYWIRQGYSINPDDDPNGWIYKQYEYVFRVTPLCIDFLAYEDDLCEIQCPDGPVSVYKLRLGFNIFFSIAARITTATGNGAGSYERLFAHSFLIPKPQACADITDFERVQNGAPCCGLTEEGCVDPLPGQGPGISGCVEVREYYFDSPTFLRLSESGVQVETDPVYDYDWEAVDDSGSYGVAPALPAELTDPHEIRLDWTSSTCCCYDDEGNSLTCNPLP